MTDQTKVGESWMRSRQIQRIIFVAIAGLTGGAIGIYASYGAFIDPEWSVVERLENMPVWLVLLTSIFFIILLIYNWIRFDEFERPRYDRSSSFGLFAGLLILPWYVASTRGIAPAPHPIACLFLIFGAKWLVHAILKLRS